MAHTAIRSSIKAGLDCYLLTLRPSHLFGFLGHDPRSQHWKSMAPWLRGIYETKQRATVKARIDALDLYIKNKLMSADSIAAFPPISVIQFEPFANGQIHEFPEIRNAVRVEDDEFETNRVLIDGLARVTSVQGVREELQLNNPEAYKILDAFRFSVALYVPAGNGVVGAEVAGQLFTDFNSYAWPVPPARALAGDLYNPYKKVAVIVGASDVMRRHGGLKSGTPNLGKKDTAFQTELAMAQFCKIVIEGKRGYGKLTKPVSDPRVASVKLDEVAADISWFLTALEQAMGDKKFADRSQLFRTAHGLYAIAVIINDVRDGRTTKDRAIQGLASLDWSWGNPQLRQHIGRSPDGQTVKMNTGTATLDWLIGYCRQACNIMLTSAA